MWLRKIYNLNKLNQVDSLTTESIDDILPYFMFIKDNAIVVNSTRVKVTKTSILFDIEIMNKYKTQGVGSFNIIKGLSSF